MARKSDSRINIQEMPGRKAPAASQTARATVALREMLVQGRFRPGERIREVPLAAELNVSRIPLHLALERLAHEGFLEIRPTRGFVVQKFSTEDIYDAIELRGLLEGAAARLAAERYKNASELATMQMASREILSLVRRTKLTMETFSRYIDLRPVSCGPARPVREPDAASRDPTGVLAAVCLAQRFSAQAICFQRPLGAVPDLSGPALWHRRRHRQSRRNARRNPHPRTCACSAAELRGRPPKLGTSDRLGGRQIDPPVGPRSPSPSNLFQESD